MTTKKALYGELARLKNQLDCERAQNFELVSRFNSIPSDCKHGEYCQICAYSEYGAYFSTYDFAHSQHYYYCTKNACKNFTLKEDKENENKKRTY